MEDAELVRRALAHDRQAFAALYDEYADGLHDYVRLRTHSADDAGDIVQNTFVLATQRLHQLRDPGMVRPWLYAIAHSEVHRRRRRADRLQFTESEGRAAMSADELVRQQELRALFAQAAAGLDEADREVLDLHVRHGLTGAEIGAALGIPERQASVVVQRVRERLGRAVGVVVLATSPACNDLAALRRAEATPLTQLSRKRLARHIDGCSICARQLASRMQPDTLLAAVPIAEAPALLRARVLEHLAEVAPPMRPTSIGIRDGDRDSDDTRPALQRREGGRVWQQDDGFPRPAGVNRFLAVVTTAVALVLLVVGMLMVRDGDSGTPSPMTPGRPIVTVPTTRPPDTAAPTFDSAPASPTSPTSADHTDTAVSRP